MELACQIKLLLLHQIVRFLSFELFLAILFSLLVLPLFFALLVELAKLSFDFLFLSFARFQSLSFDLCGLLFLLLLLLKLRLSLFLLVLDVDFVT